MKRLILLLSVFACTLTSCSNDDDNSSQDSIIGTWKFLEAFEDGMLLPLDACEDEETLIFATNGDFSGLNYDYDGTTCQLAETITGTWANEGSGSYSITTTFGTSTEQLGFSGNTFYIEYEELNNDPDPILVTYREVYIKQ